MKHRRYLDNFMMDNKKYIKRFLLFIVVSIPDRVKNPGDRHNRKKDLNPSYYRKRRIFYFLPARFHLCAIIGTSQRQSGRGRLLNLP